MNKKDALKIADEIGIKTYPSWWTGVPENELLAFANVCEKIGMEKAAKICMEQDGYHYAVYADAIRSAT